MLFRMMRRTVRGISRSMTGSNGAVSVLSRCYIRIVPASSGSFCDPVLLNALSMAAFMAFSSV